GLTNHDLEKTNAANSRYDDLRSIVLDRKRLLYAAPLFIDRATCRWPEHTGSTHRHLDLFNRRIHQGCAPIGLQADGKRLRPAHLLARCELLDRRRHPEGDARLPRKWQRTGWQSAP